MAKKRQPFSVQKYILAFFIVIMIFTFGFLLNDYLNDKRFLEINRAKRDLQVQVLSLETQFAHFEDILCADIGDDILTHELHIIGEKLQFMKNSLGADHPEVIHMRKYHTLLQIRHYHLSKELSQRCDLGLVHILFFHADQKYCPDCEKQSHILTHLRREHPWLRIYSFYYNLELPALAIVRPSIPAEFLIKQKSASDLEVPQENYPNSETPQEGYFDLEIPQKNYLPIIVIEGEPFFGFKSLEEMKELLPETNNL